MSTPTSIRFLVAGTPKPAGSKRAFVVNRKLDGKPIAVVTDDCKTSRDWKTTVSWEAKRAMANQQPLEGPLVLHLTFCLARPKSHFGSGRNFSVLRSSAPTHPITIPDVLKLARGVEDALTGIVYRDDSQIVEEHLFKKFTTFTDTQGVIIEVHALADPFEPTPTQPPLDDILDLLRRS